MEIEEYLEQLRQVNQVEHELLHKRINQLEEEIALLKQERSPQELFKAINERLHGKSELEFK